MRHLLLLPLALAACGNLNSPHQGPLQPQSVEGPCRVQPFFLLPYTATPTTMTLPPNGAACAFTLINPDLQIFPTAVIITERPTHGTVTTALVNGGRSPRIAYTPSPGARAPDRFTVTIEPNDHAVAVEVRP